MKLRIFSLLFLLVLPALSERESLVSEEVYNKINTSIVEYERSHIVSTDPEAKALREKAFAGLDDREKIRALTEWMFRKPLPHYNGTASQAKKLLIAREPVIKDYSELRRLMATETDSRRFFQLSSLSYTADNSGYDFMADRARGLFMEGVAADRGQSTTDHPLQSISMNTFSRITQKLREKSQTFRDKVYPEIAKMGLEERNLALAKWLKANWPGCENLEIPEKSRNEKSPVEDNTQVDTGERPKKPTATDPLPEAGETNTIRYLLGGMAMLIAMATAWLVLRRQKAG